MKTLVSLILSSTLMIVPTVRAEEHNDVIVLEGAPAYFTGVLVSPTRYRTYQNAMDSKPILERRLDEALKGQVPPEPPVISTGTNWIYFGLGFVAGGAVVYILRK